MGMNDGRLSEEGEFPMESEWIMMFRQIQQADVAGSSIATRVDPPVLTREKCEDRQLVELYRAVLRALFGVQSISGRNLPKPFLFISYSETGSAADSNTRFTGHPMLAEYIRRAITRGSDNLPVRIVWIEGNTGFGRRPEGEFIPSGGAVVRFTGIRRDKTDVTLVKGILHRWGMEPREFALEVEKRGGFSMVRTAHP
jgi:hypothetical protein